MISSLFLCFCEFLLSKQAVCSTCWFSAFFEKPAPKPTRVKNSAGKSWFSRGSCQTFRGILIFPFQSESSAFTARTVRRFFSLLPGILKVLNTPAEAYDMLFYALLWCSLPPDFYNLPLSAWQIWGSYAIFRTRERSENMKIDWGGSQNDSQANIWLILHGYRRKNEKEPCKHDYGNSYFRQQPR